jgi:hypothetical protein
MHWRVLWFGLALKCRYCGISKYFVWLGIYNGFVVYVEGSQCIQQTKVTYAAARRADSTTTKHEP